ncbi:hypothetical protein ACG02S_01630 [Roseateles sp. DC23W]|uniref:Uncharacterized protein n=1 Tax=Pelomonas dachongensis TaxID=3299029 RepID=A0ABW7EHE1_9BURK
MRKTVTGLAAWGLLLWGLGAQAASIGPGPFGLAPHIAGTVTLGDAAKVAAEFATPLRRPLSVSIDPRSHPLELMKIGLWMRERQPELELRGSCVGACAKSLLMSGRVKRIGAGTVIAFGGMTEMMARRKDQIDAGELFLQGDELGEASRASYLRQHEAAIESSLAVRALATQQLPLPPVAKTFVEVAIEGWKTRRMSFGVDSRYIVAAERHRCMWWVQDAAGLKQLGLDVPDYQPVSAAEAAELLKLSANYIYVGPALAVLPEQSLCPGDKKGVRFPDLP